LGFGEDRSFKMGLEVGYPLAVASQSEGVGIIVGMSLLICLTWTIVSLRLYTKYFYSKLGWDDFFMGLALVSNWFRYINLVEPNECAVVIHCVQRLNHGSGKPHLAQINDPITFVKHSCERMCTPNFLCSILMSEDSIGN
jgi:hypothetical protein